MNMDPVNSIKITHCGITLNHVEGAEQSISLSLSSEKIAKAILTEIRETCRNKSISAFRTSEKNYAIQSRFTGRYLGHYFKFVESTKEAITFSSQKSAENALQTINKFIPDTLVIAELTVEIMID